MMESSKNMGLSWGVKIFRERERSEDEEVSERPGGPPSPWVGAARLGPRPLVLRCHGGSS
jgi:hypothetical protein